MVHIHLFFIEEAQCLNVGPVNEEICYHIILESKSIEGYLRHLLSEIRSAKFHDTNMVHYHTREDLIEALAFQKRYANVVWGFTHAIWRQPHHGCVQDFGTCPHGHTASWIDMLGSTITRDSKCSLWSAQEFHDKTLPSLIKLVTIRPIKKLKKQQHMFSIYMQPRIGVTNPSRMCGR